MKKAYFQPSVNIATLKAQLAKYLRMVRAGKEVLVTDHKQPVARIVPFEPMGTLRTIKPKAEFSAVLAVAGGLKERKEPKDAIDSLSYLLEERGKR